MNRAIQSRMGRYTVSLGLAGMLLAPGGPLAAQPRGAGDTLRLTSDEAVARMRTGGAELLREQVRAQQVRADAERIGGFFPSLPELEFERTTDAPFAAHGDGGWGVHLSQEIEIGGQYFLRRDRARAVAGQADLEARSLELALRAETRSAFARLVAAQQAQELMERMYALVVRLDDIAARQLAVGEIAELDRNVVGIERARGEIDLHNARAVVGEARAELARLTGAPASSIIVAVEMPVTLAEIGAVRGALDRLDAALAAGDEAPLAARPDWEALGRARERVAADRALAGRKWVPNLLLGAGITEETTTFIGHESASERLLELRLGLQLPLPLGGAYDLGAADRAALDMEARLIDADRAALVARIRADVGRAASRLRSAAATLETYESKIGPIINRNIELLERGYAAGELGAPQIVTQQGQLIRTGEAAIEARRVFREAQAELERALAQ